MWSKTVQARLENLQELLRRVSACAEAQGFSRKRIREIELVTEEALVNIFQHAYLEGESGDVEIHCEGGGEGVLVITLRDTGNPFEIQSLPEPDLKASVSDRKIGGLGVFLIRKLTDKVEYRREGNQNVLTLAFSEGRGEKNGKR